MVYGYDYSDWSTTVDISIDASVFSLIPVQCCTLRNSVFHHHYITLPVELRLRTSTATDYDFWRVYGGYKLNYQFLNRIEPFFGPDFRLIEIILGPSSIVFGIAMGYGSWNIYFAYEI